MPKLLYCALFITLTTLLACSGPETSSPTAVAQAPTAASIPDTIMPQAEVPAEVPAEIPTETPAPTDTPSETTPESEPNGPIGMNGTEFVISELSADEQSCLSEIGDPQQLLAMMNNPELASPEQRDAVVGCLEHETLLKLFLKGFTDQTGPLSNDTQACVSTGFQDFDLRAMMLTNPEGSGEEAAMVQGMAGFLILARLPERRGVAECQSGPGTAA